MRVPFLHGGGVPVTSFLKVMSAHYSSEVLGEPMRRERLE